MRRERKVWDVWCSKLCSESMTLPLLLPIILLSLCYCYGSFSLPSDTWVMRLSAVGWFDAFFIKRRCVFPSDSIIASARRRTGSASAAKNRGGVGGDEEGREGHLFLEACQLSQSDPSRCLTSPTQVRRRPMQPHAQSGHLTLFQITVPFMFTIKRHAQHHW